MDDGYYDHIKKSKGLVRLYRLFLGVYRRAIGSRRQTLLQMSGLPIIDGFYVACIGSGLFADTGQSVLFGCCAFSGAGCVVAALHLEGGLFERLVDLLFVYLIVGGAAIGVAMAEPLIAAMVPGQLHLLTAVFLIALGMYLSGIKILVRAAKFMGVSVLVRCMLVLIAANSLTTSCDLIFKVSFEPVLLRNVGIAVLSGCLLTSIGAVAGILIASLDNFDRRPLDIGGGISLVLMGLKILGYLLPGWVLIIPLVSGCLLGFGKAIFPRIMLRLTCSVNK